MIAAGATMATPEVITSREHALAVTRDYIKQPRLSKFAYKGVCIYILVREHCSSLGR